MRVRLGETYGGILIAFVLSQGTLLSGELCVCCTYEADGSV